MSHCIEIIQSFPVIANVDNQSILENRVEEPTSQLCLLYQFNFFLHSLSLLIFLFITH